MGEFGMRMDPGAGEAGYLQLARQIREQIISGDLPLGEPLPSARSIQAEHGIGRNTYTAVVRELRRLGLVAVRPGRGVYVIARPSLEVVDLRPGDRIAARMPSDAERERLQTGYLTPLLVVTHADGTEGLYSAAVTIGEVPARLAGRDCPGLG